LGRKITNKHDEAHAKPNEIAIKGKNEGGRNQFTQTKKAKANQTRKEAQGKGQHKNKNIIRKLRDFIFLQTIY
jgi:hypothetical protein